MEMKGSAILLRIFVGESDKTEGKPLYEALVERAKRAGLAGATVFHGVLGFGATSCIHTTKVLRLSEDLPVVIEIIDRATAIRTFVRGLDAMMQGGMVTLEKVQVHLYKPRSPLKARPPR